MNKFKNVEFNDLLKIKGGGCVEQVLGGAASGALSGGLGLSGIPILGTAGGIVVGANVGAVAGSLQCLADHT